MTNRKISKKIITTIVNCMLDKKANEIAEENEIFKITSPFQKKLLKQF